MPGTAGGSDTPLHRATNRCHEQHALTAPPAKHQFGDAEAAAGNLHPDAHRGEEGSQQHPQRLHRAQAPMRWRYQS
jgi:hypothetical protein